jgi:hypothetical protein
VVARGSGDQIPWAGRVREGGPHGLRSCWATRAVRGLAIPPLTPNGPATVLSDHQCPHRRLPVWPVVLGVAVGQGHRGRRAVGYRLAAERDAGRVKMSAAQSATFVSTDRQRQLLTEPVAARGLGVSACAAPRNAVAPRGIEALTTQELEGGVGTTLGRHRQGPRGNAQALEDPPGDGFARRDQGVCLWPETGLAHVHQPDVLAHRNEHAHVLETLDAHLGPGSTPPLKRIEAAKRSAEDTRVFLSQHLLNVGGSRTIFDLLGF